MSRLDPIITPTQEAVARYQGFTANLGQVERYHYNQGLQDALEFAVQLLRDQRLNEADIRLAFAEFERVTGLDGGPKEATLPPRPKMDGRE
jgi:hypothetical protein